MEKFEKWAFGINYPGIWWVKLRFILYRDFSRTQRLNHLVLQLLWAHSYLAT
jgi:hypothetical protein